MALAYYRDTETGTIVSGDIDADPSFRELTLSKRSDRPDRFLFEAAVDAIPGYLSGAELAQRQALVAKINAALAPSPAVTVYDYQGDGTPLSDRATTLLEPYATAIAPREMDGVTAFPGEIVVPELISPTADSFG